MISLEDARKRGLVHIREDGSEVVPVTLTVWYPPVVFGTREMRLSFWQRKFEEVAQDLAALGLELLEDTVSWTRPSATAFLSVTHFEELLSGLLLRGFRVDLGLEKTPDTAKNNFLTEEDFEKKLRSKRWRLTTGEANFASQTREGLHWGMVTRIHNGELEFISATGDSRLEVLRSLDAQSEVVTSPATYLSPGATVVCAVILTLLIYLLITVPMR